MQSLAHTLVAVQTTAIQGAAYTRGKRATVHARLFIGMFQAQERSQELKQQHTDGFRVVRD